MQLGGRHMFPELHRWIPDLQAATPAAAEQTPPRLHSSDDVLKIGWLKVKDCLLNKNKQIK